MNAWFLLMAVVEAPGVALRRQGFQTSARERAFLVNLLRAGAFDVLIDSTGLCPNTLQSTRLLRHCGGAGNGRESGCLPRLQRA